MNDALVVAQRALEGMGHYVAFIFAEPDQRAHDLFFPRGRHEVPVVESKVTAEWPCLVFEDARKEPRRTPADRVLHAGAFRRKGDRVGLQILFADIEMLRDAPQIMRGWHATAVQIAIELLPVQADVAADLRDTAVICAERPQVS